MTAPSAEPSKSQPPAKTSLDPNRATVTVYLPADANLSVDGTPCTLTSDIRTFDTPALEPGQKYYYTLKTERMEAGHLRTQTRRVFLEAGNRVTVRFDETDLPRTAQK
jgi:uncharacterized protein (TIGR03000 family)